MIGADVAPDAPSVLQPMIDLRTVSYIYPQAARPALEAVDLQVDAGEFVLLAGHSGSGKSTLLRVMNGLVPHFTGGRISGRVLVNGIEAIGAGPRALSMTVGFVNQNPENQALLERVEEEIAFPLEQAAVPSAEMRERVSSVLRLLELVPLRERSLTTLSGGERQRVAIATALAMRPQALLLDEPTSQLDPEAAHEVLEALARLNLQLGLTIVIAEHRLERIIGYTPRTILLENGRIVRDGPTRALAPDLPHRPPLVEIGVRRGWDPLPLTQAEAQPYATASGADADAPRQDRDTKAAVAIAQPLLEVRDLTVAYSDQIVLKGINLTLHEGELLVIMGRNGSGKSTLLRSIMGLVQPMQGEVWANGHKLSGRKTAEIAREIGMLPQNPDDLLYAETVEEELLATLRNHDRADKDAVASMLEQLHLSALGQAYPRDLSSGQRQRVALGAVTVAQPQIAMLDEPTRGIDGRFKQQMINLWRVWQGSGMGLLVVTHDVELAAQVADRIIVLEQGQVLAAGEPQQVLDGSSLFTPETARLFPGTGWLTPAEALAELPTRSLPAPR